VSLRRLAQLIVALLVFPSVLVAQGIVLQSPLLAPQGLRLGPVGTGQAVVYEILELGANTPPTAWNSAAFDTATIIPWLGYDNTGSLTCTAKIIWQNTTTDVIYGSVDCNDTDDEIVSLTNDASSWFNTGHDNIDFRWCTTTERVLDGNCRMVSANLDNKYFDAAWSGTDNARDSSVNLNTTVVAVVNAGSNWKIFFKANVGQNIAPGLLGLGNFTVRDKDSGVAVTGKSMFGTTANALLDINQFGYIRFSATTLPDPPPDTTAPVVSAPASSSVASTTATVTGSTNEAGSCRVRRGTSTGVYTSTTTSVSSVSGNCTLNLSSLTEGTTYYAVVDVTDASGNVGTSSEINFSTTSSSNFYVATTGSGSTCSNASPCAVSRLTATTEPKPSPGETWIIKDGTYNQNTTFDCSAGMSNGTAQQPITIKAENERLAFLRGTGTADALQLANCSYWIIDGPRIENQDNAAFTGSTAAALRLQNSNDNVIKNVLVRNPNRYGNNSLIGLVNSSRNVLQDIEGLYFHRNGVNESSTGSTFNIVRRTYLNPQGAKIGAGYFGHPNDCFMAYNWADSIWENNIGENCENAFVSVGPRNRYYGNIALNASQNGFAPSHGVLEGTGRQADNNEFYHNVSVGHAGNGIFCRTVLGSFGCKIENFTSYGGANGVGADNNYDSRRGCDASDGCQHTHSPRHDVTNALVIDSTGSRFYVNNSSEFASIEIDYSHGWPSSGAWGSGTSGRTNSPPTSPGNVDPGATFDTCPVFVATSSPMKGAGAGGADIGANVLYAYSNGALGAEKLWNSTTDAWNFIRATISGVNSTNSLSTVHSRLHPSCASWPSGY
jgi:hypothetical protein